MSDEKTIVKKASELVESEGTDLMEGKILHVSEDTEGIDLFGIIARLSQYANVTNAITHVQKEMLYVVQIPVKYQKAFDAGDLMMNQNSKTGVLWPTLYEKLDTGKRKFVDNLPIKQEEVIQGSPFESIAVSYHNIYMQQQINELAELMKQTYKAVERIEQGQMDDRIGLLMAGRDQIVLAMHLEGSEKELAIALGRNQIFTAQRQLLQTFMRRVTNFEPLSDSGWNRFWTEFFHDGYHSQKDKEFYEIQGYYSLYLQATQMLAQSYTICGQLEEAESVFKIAEQDMSAISFEALKTLRYIHEKNENMLYYHAGDYIDAEKEICMEQAKDYDGITIEVTGEKLLEVFKNVRTEEICESDAE